MIISDSSARQFYVMAKPAGSHCNLRCDYCYYLEKEKFYSEKGKSFMNDRTLESFIAQYIYSSRGPEVLFTWHGGEPLLCGISFFENVILLQNKYSGGKRISNSLQTNGTLLNDEWCRFFKKHEFLIGISIDGPEHCNDHYRKFSDSRPSFAKVMNGLELLKKHKIEFNTLSVVNDYNSHFPEEVYHFLKESGSHYMQFTPIVERIDQSDTDGLQLQSPAVPGNANFLESSVDPELYGNFIIRIFDDWVKKDVGKYFVINFDCLLANRLGVPPPLCMYAEECGHAAVMEHNGDIYSCDHFVFPEYKIGNIKEISVLGMMNSEAQLRFGHAKKDLLPRYCLNCAFLSLCNGECPKNRFINSPDGEPGLNYFCKGLKNYYRHTIPYIDFMANEVINGRPAANVMAKL